MNQNPKHYEEVVARLLKTKLAHDQGEIPTIYTRKVYTGASGQNYEIDVSFETIHAETHILVLIECKCYKHRVGLDDVTEFAYKIQDIGAHKGIMVTTKGFQSGAVKIAKREGIALVVAVRAWHVISYKLSPGTPRYVIFSEDGKQFRTSHGMWEEFVITSDPNARPMRMPALSYEIASLDTESDKKGISFIPAIDGFHGDPFDVISAASVFCIESGNKAEPFDNMKNWSMFEGPTG
jgi:hypothetical protein